MKRFISKTIVMVTILALLFNTYFSQTVIAKGSPISDNTDSAKIDNAIATEAARQNSSDVNNAMNGYKLDSANIVGEIIDKRDKYTKHFMMDDGTFQAVVYGTAVNYKKADGTWAEVNNTLQKTKDSNGNPIFKTKDNGYMGVSFADDAKSNKLVSIAKGKNILSWQISSASTTVQAEPGTAAATSDVAATDESASPSPAPSPSDMPAPTATDTLGATDMPSVSETPTDTPTITDTPAATDTSTAADTPTATETPTATDTPSPTDTPAATDTPAPEISASPIATKATTSDGNNGSVKALNILSVTPSVIDDYSSEKTKLTGNALKRLDDKATSHIKYTGLMQGVNIDYMVEAERVKENITLSSYIPGYSISFDISAAGLTIKNLAGGVVAFCNGKTEVFYLMPSSIFDNTDNEGKVNTTLEPIKDGYRLTLTPDDEWLKNAMYPVVLDPQIDTDWNASNINDTYISSKYPNGINNDGTNGPWCGYADLRIGYSDSYDTSYALVKYVNLPQLTSSEAVVGAYMISERDDTYPSTGFQFSIHNITKNWNQTSVTWDNFINSSGQAFDPAIQEIQTVDDAHGPNGYFYTWDITNLMREWYTGAVTNYGLLIKGETTDDGYRRFYAANATYVDDLVKTVIQYVNTAGLESSWSYQSMDARRAGTANVNLFTGNLVVSHSDIGVDGNRMPVSISHVYNAVYKDDANIGYGMGWRVNYAQTIVGETISGVQYYDYTDEDGTIHYFQNDTGSTYIDESGQNRKLEFNKTITDINNNTVTYAYTITDKSDNVMCFDSSGRLVKIKDCIGSYISIAYSGTTKKITTITDGAARTYTFAYNASGDLYTITAPGSRVISYTYDGSHRLTNITYPDNKQTTYTYTTSGNLNNTISNLKNFDGYNLDISYIYTTLNGNLCMSPKVSNIQEWGDASKSLANKGGSQTFTYYEKETKVKDHLGNINIYQFNQYGNTVTIQDDQGRAVYCQYYNPTANVPNTSTPYGQNKMSLSSRLQEPVMNYALNSSFEDATNWSSWLNNAGGSITRTTAQKLYGSYSVSINTTSEAGNNEYYQDIDVQKGKTYTLSVWEESPSGISTTTGGGAVLQGRYQDSAGTYYYVTSLVTGIQSDWNRMNITFTVPSDSVSSSIRLILENYHCTGTSYFDGFQVELQPVVNRYNLVQNGDMSASTSGTPDYWTKSAGCTGSDVSTTTSDTDRGLLDNDVFKIVGDAATDKSLSQTIAVSGSLGDSFSFGGWAKASAAPLGTRYPLGSYGRQYGIKVELKNGSTSAGSVTVPFNDFSNLWQYLSGRVVATGTYTSAVITLLYENEVNTAYFDGIQLYKEEFGQYYTYDAKGNLVTAKDLNDKTSTVGYDADNNPTTLQPPDCTGDDEYTTTYYNQTGDPANKKHLVKTTTTVEGVNSAYSYDTYGNTTQADTKDSLTSPTAFIRTKADYTTNGNYTLKSYDSRGCYITYDYSANYGVNLDTSDPSSQKINYTYDNSNSAIKMGKLTDVSTTVGGITYSNSYDYVNDLLTTITHNGFDYTLGYNVFGQPTTVSVAGQNLVTNNYVTSDRSYLLDNLMYGNGGKVDFSYDDRYRVNAVAYDNESSARYKYTYAANGQLGTITDSQNSLTTNLYYDLADRPMKTVEKYSSGLTRLFQYTYDIDNCLTDFLEKFGSTNYETKLTYDKDNRIKTVDYANHAAGSENIRYSYVDPSGQWKSLGRLYTRTLETGTSDYVTTYSYLDGGYGTGSTTSTVSSIVNKLGNTVVSSLSYTYDNCGRILTKNDGINTKNYTYDALGQLIRTDDPTDPSANAKGSIWVYAYDAGGNITSKTLYAPNLDANGNPIFCNSDLSSNTIIHAYAYTYDPTWKDELTSYDGNAINYEQSGNIGNPYTYNGWTFTWEAGRQLKQMQNSGTGVTLQFKYNDAGLRTQKINGATTTKYYWSGSVLSDMTNGTDTLHFWYDAAGNPAMMTYNGANYYFLENQQGDIIGLLDATGAQQVTYSYDSWGKLLSVKDGDGTDESDNPTFLGNINPLRYRGYIFDNETGLYYLQSRYYNPAWGRFINSDEAYIIKINEGLLIGINLFAYCCNNPVSISDPNGYRQLIGGKNLLEEDELCHEVFTLGVTSSGNMPNEIIDVPNTNGGIRNRYWCDDKGDIIHSRDYTDHGNPKNHPYVPHDHDWDEDDKGNNKPGSGHKTTDEEYKKYPDSKSKTNNIDIPTAPKSIPVIIPGGRIPQCNDFGPGVTWEGVRSAMGYNMCY